MDNIIEIKNLNKTYKEFALKDISFCLPRGYIMGFVGQNGSGKTTTIRSILNMAHIDSGEIKIFGLNSTTDYIQIKQKIGVVFDEIYFATHLNIRQIQSQIKGFYTNWDTMQFNKLIKRFNLPEKKNVGSFSKGMKMKFMVACALSHNAELIILDEPTSGLDPVARDELLDILTEYISDENKSILFSTHITADLERIADYITILNDGRIFYSDTKDNLLEKYVVIKGDEKDLSIELKEKSLGFHNYRNGFEALLERVYIKQLPNSIEFEKANIDDILVYLSKEVSHEYIN